RPVTNGIRIAGGSPHKSPSIHFASPPRTTYASPYAQPTRLPVKLGSPGLSIVNVESRAAQEVERRPSGQGMINPNRWSSKTNDYNSLPTFQSGQRPNGEHAFPLPQPYSLTSLPPPPQ